MRTQLATLALAGALGVSGVAGAALVAPAVSYAATGDSAALDARVSSLTSALAGLVTDGSITQDQADEVATTLAAARPEGFGRGRHGGGRVDTAAAADALGITSEELRTRTQAGQTLADIAEAEGVAESELVDALVTGAKTRLSEAVTAGRLTQAEADARATDLEAGITESLDELCVPGGGRGGPGDGGADDSSEDGAVPSTAPSAGTSSDA